MYKELPYITSISDHGIFPRDDFSISGCHVKARYIASLIRKTGYGIFYIVESYHSFRLGDFSEGFCYRGAETLRNRYITNRPSNFHLKNSVLGPKQVKAALRYYRLL